MAILCYTVELRLEPHVLVNVIFHYKRGFKVLLDHPRSPLIRDVAHLSRKHAINLPPDNVHMRPPTPEVVLS